MINYRKVINKDVKNNALYIIYIFIINYIYNQMLQATAARKMIAVIAAYTNRKVTEADLAQYRQQHPGTEDGDEEIRAVLINDGCSEDYRRMFGQRSRREGWSNV